MFVNPPYLYRKPVDFRKAIDDLVLIVEQDEASIPTTLNLDTSSLFNPI